MASIFGFFRRNWQVLNPPAAKKTEKPLKFGIFGAANIGPMALITPAKIHPDVVVHAVAARDPEKARAYAAKYGIPEVKQTYQDILDDPEIDCVYIPLPNGLHFEWTLRALRAGKHVLLEKPSVNNSAEAERLFQNNPVLDAPDAPVLMEASHYAFHPAWIQFMSYVSPKDVASARVNFPLRWVIGQDDIRYKYDLGGGAMMDLGFYTSSVLMRVFGGVPESCEECTTVPSASDAQCDRAFNARFRFPGGGVGVMEGDFESPLSKWIPRVEVVHKPVVVSAEERATVGGAAAKLKDGQEVIRTRKLNMTNFLIPTFFHSIWIEDEFAIRNAGEPNSVVKRWTKSRTVKSYSFREMENKTEQPGEPYWLTYTYQLEQFVNKVRGHEVKQWISHEDSVNVMRIIDMGYAAAANMPLRPTSEFK